MQLRVPPTPVAGVPPPLLRETRVNVVGGEDDDVAEVVEDLDAAPPGRVGTVAPVHARPQEVGGRGRGTRDSTDSVRRGGSHPPRDPEIFVFCILTKYLREKRGIQFIAYSTAMGVRPFYGPTAQES